MPDKLTSKHLSTISADDVAGFYYALDQFVAEARDPSKGPEWREVCDRLHYVMQVQCERRKALDEHRRRSIAVKRWMVGEPCIRNKCSAVVISTAPSYVAIRVFELVRTMGRQQARHRIIRCNPDSLVKVASNDAWDRWSEGMRRCGRDPNEWTTMMINHLIADVVAV